SLGNYGAKKVIAHNNTELDSQQLTKLVTDVAKENNSSVVIFSQDLTGKAVAPRVAVRLEAGFVSGAIALPTNDFTVKVNAFSGKAYANVKINSATKVISVTPNSLQPEAGEGTAEVQNEDCDLGATKITVKSKVEQSGEIALPEAELVVSAGRGLKGPENWGIVEDLAKALGAATACSRPVADSDWRPHHEHVGQTGVAIRPNLYIAAGISGAIQHLAGVNQSKVIVVINTDPEAPFFKAADYGIVGDAFEVLPRLTEAVKAANL
ncbi:MAG: electron transfer flavoprotein subunit alpha/FixB family protein, partial [Flavobacteriales bacterium]